MWLLLKGLALRFVVGRTVGGMFAALLFVLLPLAGILKVIGLPLLAVLGVVAAPLFLLLGVIGLPILFVAAFGGMLLLLLGALLTIGLVAIKVVVSIVLVVWFARWMLGGPKLQRDTPLPPDEPLGPVGG